MLTASLLVDQRYRLAARLGEGTFGEVWQAADVRLSNRAVAVKFLKAEFLAHAEAVSRFESEADALAQVQHANVVGVLDRGMWSGHRYLVTEFVPGAPLTDWLDGHRQRREFPSLAMVAGLLDQLCAGVEAAHAVRVPGPIVHRDLKPDNVLLRDQVNGEAMVKIVDFGIAQLGGRSGTRTGAMMGTPLYMAPEQALGNTAAVAPATDVFALAVIAVELLTLRAQPADGEPWWGLAMQRPGEIRDRLGALRGDVPSAVWDVIVAALHPRSAERVQTAGALRSGLHTAFASSSLPFARTVASVGPPLPTVAPGVPGPALAQTVAISAGVSSTLWSAPPPSTSTTAPLTDARTSAGPVGTRGRWIVSGVAGLALVALAIARRSGGDAVNAVSSSVTPPPSPTRRGDPPPVPPAVPAPTIPSPPTVQASEEAADQPPAPLPADSAQLSLNAAPVLRTFIRRWIRALGTATETEDFGVYYADQVSWQSALRDPSHIREQAFEKVAAGGSLTVDLDRSTWRLEDPQSPDAARTCRELPNATGQTRLVRAWAVGVDPRRDGRTMCQRLEGVYLLRIRQVAPGGWRICQESWSLREGICASCPTAAVCRRGAS